MSAQRANQLIEAGVWLQATGDFEGARRLFEQALRLDPENARAKELLSRKPSRHSAMGSRPPMVPPSWNPFRSGEPLSPAPPLGDGGEDGEEGEWDHGPGKELSPNAVSAWDTKSNPGMLVDSGRDEPHDALSLVSAATPLPLGAHRPRPPEPREEIDKLIRRAKDLQELDDHSGAMEVILKAQELAPMNREVKMLRDRSESILLTMYESKLGGLDRVPRVGLKEDEIIWLNLDHRAGYMLAQIDGHATFEELFAISGMARLDTARILAQLVEEGVIKAS
jgi:tetratricopeptide (TPR) repeat protein